MENKIPFLVIDIAKQDYRHLVRLFPEIKVIRGAKEFRLNPLKPPKGATPQEGMSDFIDAHKHLTDVMMRSESVLVDAVDELYAMFGVYKGNEEYPNLKDLEEWLSEKMKRHGYRSDDFLLRNYQRCHMLNATTDIFDCREGSDLEGLLNEPVILELYGLPDNVINYVTINLLTQTLRYRLANRLRGRLMHVTIADECKRIFPRSAEMNFQMGTPPIDYLVSYAREFGECIIAADQEISKLTTTLRANTNTKISLFTTGPEVSEIKKTFNLSEEKVEILGRLPKGTAIMKPEGNIEPFIVRIDHLPVVRDVTDKEAEEHSREFVRHINRTVKPRSNILLRMLKKGGEQRLLSKTAEDWLIHTARNPYMSILERTSAFGITSYMANKVAKELEIKGYARKINVHTGKPGHPIILTDLTQKGIEHLESIGEKIARKGHGGLRHQFWQHRLSQHLQSGNRKAVIEPRVEGANTDVLVMDSEGKRTAVEIALSEENQIENIRRDLLYFDAVLMAAETKLLMTKIKEEASKCLTDEEFGKVAFCLLGDFLP